MQGEETNQVDLLNLPVGTKIRTRAGIEPYPNEEGGILRRLDNSAGVYYEVGFVDGISYYWPDEFEVIGGNT